MHFSVFNDCDWLYPDSDHSDETCIRLNLPIGGHDGVQILGDMLDHSLSAHFNWDGGEGPEIALYRLLPVGVNENTSATLMTTTDYASCRDFVTRKAPFEVFDALRPLDDSEAPDRKRLALYLSVRSDFSGLAGDYSGTLTLTCGDEISELQVRCTVHQAQVPPPAKARLGMLNFFSYDGPVRQHGLSKGSHAYWESYRSYVRAQLDMRCTHILLPAGEAIYEDGKLKDFDFTWAEKAGQIAMEEGAPFLCGGHIAHWHAWDDSEYYPNWDQKTSISTDEGYLELRQYFSRWAEVIKRNGWQDHMTQALADEPQTYNANTYRVLAAICRKFLPGIPIIDAVETTNLGGGVDIWVPKQETYEKWQDAYRTLQEAGEIMWFYTCAFPAGPYMNRSMDLPLAVSRTVLWMGAYYRLSGFLHWGFNYYIGDDIWHSACCPHKGALLPAGDAHIVYPGPDGKPYRSMRFEAQLGGAEDYELLMQLIERSPEKADHLIQSVCTGFSRYNRDGGAFKAARLELFKLLEEVSSHV